MPPTVAVPTDPGLQQQQLRQRLAAVRRRLRFVTAFRGACWLLVILLGGAAVAGVLDWKFHLPGVIRALLLVATLAGGGVIFYRRLLLPLRVKDDDLTLALRIEQLYPGLNDSFASAVQFLDTEDANNSAALRREAVSRGLRGVSKCDFSRLVNTRGLWRLGALAALPILTVLGLGLWQPLAAEVSLARFLNPFGAPEWPHNTRITEVVHRPSIGHNEPFDVSGRLLGVIPEDVTVAFRLDGSGPATEYTAKVQRAEDGKSGTFAARLEAGKSKRDTFSFQVRANDAIWPENGTWQKVTVLPPPQLVPLEGKASPQVHLSFPAYTQVPDLDLEPGSGKVVAVNGSVVTLRAATDRPLAAAWVEFRPEPPSVNDDLLMSPLGAGSPFGALAVAAAGRAIVEEVPATLQGDRRQLIVTFVPPISGNYVLHFRDDTGLQNSRMFELNVFADPSPVVTLERPTPARDNLIVLPDATLDLQVLAEDQQFAVRQVWLEYRCKKTDPPRRLPLFVPGPEMKERPQRVPVGRKLALKDFKHLDPAEGGLKDGDVLTIQACADDYDDVSAGKEPGRSHEVEIRIVGQNALELVINQAQAKVQQDLVALRKLEDEATKKVNDVQQRLKENGKLTQDDLDQLLQAEETQRLVRDRIGDEKEGLRAEVERIRETLRENPLPRSGSETRMERVAKELDRLSREELPQIEPRLTNARKQDEGGPNKQDRAAARAQAEKKEDAAREAERLAAEKEKAAAEAERLAKDKPKDSPERLKLEQEAEAKRKEAQAERDKAKQLQNEAKEQRQQADAGAPQLLQEAKQHQEEVGKTLNDLLNNTLDSFTSTQEVKGEAKSLLEDEKRLQKETEELRLKDLGQMTPQEQRDFKAAAERLQAEQQKLKERTDQLLDKMERVAQERKDRDPETAKEMQAAVDQGRKDDISGSMKEAQDRLGEKQPSKAVEKEKEAVEKLQNLAQQLEDRREAELNRTAKNLRKEEQELKQLQDDMEKLRKKVQEAEKIQDPEKRRAELERLAREQKELEEKVRRKAEQLTRERSPRAGQAAQQAADAMRRAAEKLNRGQAAPEEDKEALDRLQEAQQEVNKARQQVEEELEREELAKVADQIRAMKERQESLIAERERIQKSLLQQPENWRKLLISLGDLSRNQGAEQGLAKDLAALAEKKLEGAPVFARLLKRTSETMDQAAKKLKEHQGLVNAEHDKPETEAVANAARLQKEALDRLTGVLDTLKEEQNAPLAARNNDGGGGGGGDGGDGGGAGAGNGSEIPPLAQLKLLRQMQAEVNKRTDDFRKDHPDPTKLDEKAKADLQDIRRSQQEVAELLDELIEPDEGGGDKP
jgi:hypothetical protein